MNNEKIICEECECETLKIEAFIVEFVDKPSKILCNDCLYKIIFEKFNNQIINLTDVVY